MKSIEYDSVMPVNFAVAVKQLNLDHDHDTGQVRGELCNKHNQGLGFFDDDPKMLRTAAEYIERYTHASS